MSTSPEATPIPSFAVLLAVLAVAGASVGCATSTAGAASMPHSQHAAAAPSVHAMPLARVGSCSLSPAVRYGRYTLIELAPDAGQRDLMQQIIDVTFPAGLATSVADAIRYVLRRSGYQLCASGEDIHILDNLPLPAAQMHLGPLTLRDALEVLAGRAWKLRVDEATRQVCFSRRTRFEPDRVQSTRAPAISAGEPTATALPQSAATPKREP